MRLGEQLVKLTLDAYYNAIRPEANHETWLLKTTLTFSVSGPAQIGSQNGFL